MEDSRTESIIKDLQAIRAKSPLVHNITNYVAMNNTANALLAVGASPVMAHAAEEVTNMTSIASALVINIGTLDAPWVASMLLAGETALKNQVPLVLDPVGVGATPYRTDTCKQIINQCKPGIIRGNASEILALRNANATTKGVDSTDTSDSALETAKQLAQETSAVVVISGEVDYITDGTAVNSVANGSPLMSRITAMGCTATAIVGAFAAVNPNKLAAATNAMAIMGIAGDIAAEKSAGPGTMQANFIDALFNLTDADIAQRFKA